MRNDELAEIRALLQATAPPERRPRKPMLGIFRTLLAPQSPDPARPVGATVPAARRVGLRASESLEAEALDELVLVDPAPAQAGPDPTSEATAARSRRNAFGQRQDPAGAPPPLRQLAAPSPPSIGPELAEVSASDPAPLPRRRPFTVALAETPYMADDLADHAEEPDRFYKASGLFDARPALPTPEAESDPQHELLRHLERVFLAERAALRAAARPA